ncbi:type IV toxin-antitoxin system AbiEi family antitoxin [Budvicia diplopodorum]|uniref:type IV toxin-antitoxin system AbiEi family antitoxin n=1 Tax=Budvicia diplopodorum TaxID=1119056 RepID=UPI00135AAC7C|nr:type IV toxin-antitoxin system AbiEi family antitoxin [Budvicia diplopodorum]
MSTEKLSKINTLLSALPSGIALTSSWLTKQGYSLDLQKKYKESQWFNSIGTGALIRNGDRVDYLGGIYALQSQLGLSIHPGAKTALSLQGKAHYLGLAEKKALLFGTPGEKLPTWFDKHQWGINIDCKLSSFLPAELGLVEIAHKGFTVKVSSPARAIMECLYLAPNSQPLIEVYELMEGLNNLRPATVQPLLESCSSVKVKRLFLYLAEKAGHEWLNHIAMQNIDLGTGKRAIVDGGVYISKYQITVPKELGLA